MTVLCIVLYAVSLAIVLGVLLTGDRKYKNVAHLSWITATIALALTCFFVCIYSLSAVMIHDVCSVYKYAESKNSTANFTGLWPEEVSPLLD
jgi:uncharacterized membrane protein